MGSSSLTPLALAFSSAARGDVDLVGLNQRLAGALAQRVEKGVRHAAADQQRVGLVQQVVDHVDLAGDLGAADDGDEGPVRLGEHLAQEVQFFFHQQAGGRLCNEVGDALGGGVGAVRAAEGVVDVEVAQFGELLGEGGIVGLLFRMEAQVLQQQRLPGLQLARHLLGDLADAVGREGHVLRLVEDLVEQHAQTRRQGRRLIDSTGLPLGRPRCEQRMTLALWRSAYSMVGRVSRMRVSSVMTPSFSGTLKSTRMSTRLWARSRSRIDSLGIPTEYVVLPSMGNCECNFGNNTARRNAFRGPRKPNWRDYKPYPRQADAKNGRS